MTQPTTAAPATRDSQTGGGRDVRRLPYRMTVLATERIAPHLQRLTIGDGDIDAFLVHDRLETDKYVKLLVFPAGVEMPDPLDLQALRASWPIERLPTVRTYTLRDVDHTAGTLTIDFVLHGDEGVAGPWAAAVRPGDLVAFTGPGSGYGPDPAVDWHLLAGDESAIPAISAALRAMPRGAVVDAYVEVDGPADEMELTTDADLHLTWLHRAGATAGTTTLLADAILGHPWRDGRVQVFVHGESGLLRAVRAYLRGRGIDKELLSISGYWRRGETEEGFRTWKRQQPQD